jgi:hypothetical protein
MPAVTIQGGMKVEIPNRDEIRQDFRDIWTAQEREQARGVKWMDFAIPIQPAAASTLVPGPEEGYSWSAKVLGVTLSAAATVAVYKATSTGQTTRPLAQPVASVAVNSVNIAVFTWSSNQGFLQHGQDIYVQTSTGNLVTVYLAAEEAVAEQAYKIFD